MQTLQGHFLVASPKLPDENFYRSVVLMIQHDNDGAFGVILNRPTDNSIQEIWEQVSEEPCACSSPVHIGGPVSGPLLAIHGLRSCAETSIMPGVYVATQKDYLNEIVQQTAKPFRIFSGYAGWAGGQLESELDVGGWLTAEATKELVFADPDDLWKRVARSIGLDILSPALPRLHIPDDPSMN